jgi:tRNA nucleotidyltransferase (CCA-adding enzyme)
MTQVREIMSKCSVTLRPETTLAEAALRLVGHHVDGAPVVTADRTLVGIISEQQLFGLAFDFSTSSSPVSKYMTENVFSAEPQDSLLRVAELLAQHSFRRIPVVESGKLVGVVTRRDLIGHALRSGSSLGDPPAGQVPELIHAR